MTDDTRNVYQRLNDAREEFHGLKLTKTGENKFAGYKYFELGDFLIPAMSVFKKHGLCAVVSFEVEEAYMRIFDIATGNHIVIRSPMGSAALKGCHEVQNIGAVETYQRRYLWTAALEIVEHDALDATTGKTGAVNADLITEAQVMDLETVASDVGANLKAFCEYFKINRLEDIRAVDFDKARTALLAKKRKAA